VERGSSMNLVLVSRVEVVDEAHNGEQDEHP
jgi:hypothetical protein